MTTSGRSRQPDATRRDRPGGLVSQQLTLEAEGVGEHGVQRVSVTDRTAEPLDPGVGMHRHGVGSALVRAVLQRAAKRRTVVSTGCNNIPAKIMYEHLGFVRVEDEEVIPGLWVTRYRWTAA